MRDVTETDAPTAASPDPELSIVIPTRNEDGNVEELLSRIQSATGGIDTEVIFVDDSDDSTPTVIREVSSRFHLAISVLHRPLERRSNGLGGAVVEGIRAASGRWVSVMDGDLQHPPEIIPKLLDSARDQQVDLVVASRFASPDDVDGLSLPRLAVSKLTGETARLLFPHRLARVSDPLTGFFLVRRAALDPDQLQPRGFKILLEILIRFPKLKVTEIPFQFGKRHSGESKASLREGIRYVKLLLQLRLGPSTLTFARFALVGLSGIVVNQLLLAALTELMGIHYVVSAVLATQGSTLWNFALTDWWAFGERSRGHAYASRLGKFWLMNNLMLLARGPFLVFLTASLGIFYLLSNLITLVSLTAVRFFVSDGLIWSAGASGARRRTVDYDIHGIIRISSEEALPELEYFRTQDPVGQPDLRVHIGHIRKGVRTPDDGTTVIPQHFHYREILGPVGFWLDITRGHVTDVVVAPLLRSSPHVLYTNVVEPILRWMLVQKGYALVHGACIGSNGRAVLVTARTDTGKTSSILRLMAKTPVGFLSDDMVVLAPDGRVLCYPKPLTISFHTLGAISGQANLSRLERLALVIQSRVHSKSGRLMALLLSRVPVPAATINAIVQLIVPPPKFAINRLIPRAIIGREAIVTHRVEIERGPDHQVPLPPDEAESTLLRNCDDAYGFPPYQALEPFLRMHDGRDLKKVERELIRQSLGPCAVTLISSESRDWWGPIAAIVHAHATGATGLAQPTPSWTMSRPIAAPLVDLAGETGRVQEIAAPMPEVTG